MSNDDRFAYEVRSAWAGHLAIWTFVKWWSLLIVVLAGALGIAIQSFLGAVVAAIMFWPLPMVYAGPLLVLSAFEQKRVRVLLARDADTWMIETETDLGPKVRRGALADLDRAEVEIDRHGHPRGLVLIEFKGARHRLLGLGGRFAFLDLLTIARSEDEGRERGLPKGWGHKQLLADMAARINAFLRPSADPDAVMPLGR